MENILQEETLGRVSEVPSFQRALSSNLSPPPSPSMQRLTLPDEHDNVSEGGLSDVGRAGESLKGLVVTRDGDEEGEDEDITMSVQE